ncbi:hypothetical protein ACFXG4_27355 [Nocardia sp. NPDC059246]|uniref:hypothetical protein n=1 Tax=unclassified Nocardia TaxID=2637762 RepID=UPI0036C48DED
MTTEVATTTDDQFVPTLGSGFGDPLGAVTVYLDVIDTAYNLAEKLCRTPLAGPVYRGKPADAAVAILYGAEIGLNPIQSLQQIFTVHGTPAIYARTMVAMLKRRGYRFHTVESTGTVATVTGTAPGGDTETSTWTIERAIQAGYVPRIDEKTGKYALNANGKLDGNMKYLTDPANMLYAKAAAEVCRRLAPDVLLGISRTSEDLESEPAPAPVRVASERISTGDVLGDAAPPPVVVEWVDDRAAEAPSDSSAKPEPAQVDTPAEPEQPKRPRTTRKADKPAAPNLITAEQSEKIGELMTKLKVTDEAQQRDFASMILQKPVPDPSKLTIEEGEILIAELIETLAAEQAKAAAEGGAQ